MKIAVRLVGHPPFFLEHSFFNLQCSKIMHDMMNVVVAKTFSGTDCGITESNWYRTANLFNSGKFINEDYDRFEHLYILNREELAASRKLTYESELNSYIFIIPLKGSLIYQGVDHGSMEILAGEILLVPSSRHHSFSIYNKSETDSIQFIQLGFITSDYVAAQFPQVRKINPLQEINQVQPIRFDQDYFPFEISFAGYESRAKDAVKFKNPNTHVFTYLMQGSMIIENHLLQEGDAIGLWNVSELKWQNLEGLSEFLVITFSVPEPKPFLHR